MISYGMDSLCFYQNEHLTYPDGTCIYQYKNTWEQLEKLIVGKDYDPIQFMEGIIDNCGVWTDHCYLIGEWEKLYVKDNKKREYRITPKLESFFKYVGEKKKEGTVWNPTMSEFCDYMVSLENVFVRRSSRGVYQIDNNGKEIVPCSFFYSGAGDLILNGKPVHVKQVKRGRIFWGELEPGVNSLEIIGL